MAGPVITIQDVSAIYLAVQRKVPHRLFVFSIQKIPCQYLPDKRKLLSDLSRCTGNPWRYLINYIDTVTDKDYFRLRKLSDYR